MKITIDIPNPPSEQRIIDIPIHFCGGQVVDAGGYGFEERKTGKWVHLPNVWGVVFCSECNYDLRINDTKYCPNCGAKMEGAEE